MGFLSSSAIDVSTDIETLHNTVTRTDVHSSVSIKWPFPHVPAARSHEMKFFSVRGVSAMFCCTYFVQNSVGWRRCLFVVWATFSLHFRGWIQSVSRWARYQLQV